MSVNSTTVNLPEAEALRERCVRREVQLAELPGELYTATQLREIDRLAIAAGTPGIVLMRRAAAAALAAMQQRWTGINNILVLCGGGNNGGDGYLFARLAAQRGLAVVVAEMGAPNTADATTARAALLADGLQPQLFSELPRRHFESCELIIDALLGTGVSGSVRPQYAAAIDAINAAGRPVLALDLPSGLCSDSGAVLGHAAVIADLTVSFIGLKRGAFTAAACNHVGELVLATLEVDCPALLDSTAAVCLDKLEPLLAQLPPRRADHYKNRSGHVLVIGGNYGMAGAVVLAARAALRCGAGLVSVATRPEHVSALVAAQPEIMAHGIEKSAALAVLLERASAVLIGPGLGQDSWAQQLLLGCKNIAVPLVIDADALNLIAGQAGLLPASEAILTPHLGEARRLAAVCNNAPDDRFALAQTLCTHYQKTIVLKGPGTIVADQNQTSLGAYGNQALATAGTGDVLSGVLAALLAQGMPPRLAARLGVCLHGAAADQWVSRQGPRGMLAGDLPGELAALLNRLL